MPEVAREGRFRLYFWSNENQTDIRPELPHVHVECDDEEAEFWLNPGEPDISLKADYGLKSGDLRRAEALVRKYRKQAIIKWNEHFGTDYSEN